MRMLAYAVDGLLEVRLSGVNVLVVLQGHGVDGVFIAATLFVARKAGAQQGCAVVLVSRKVGQCHQNHAQHQHDGKHQQGVGVGTAFTGHP